eukprot:3659578-Lingulodinium_polyedra.AAC.1
MGFPMTHVDAEFPCIAKYPVDVWEKAGAPTMTTTGWAKLYLKVAEKDMKNLQTVFNVAETFSGKKKGSESEEGTEGSAA